MIDATGPATSPDSLGTYNTAVDAPSGKGLNNIVASIQTALNNYVRKMVGVAAGDVPVWNGSTWVVPSGSRTGSNFLRDDGQWASPTSTLLFRKVTAKAATNSVAETDLLNGEFTLTANALATNKTMRLTLWGDNVFTAGAAQAAPQFKFKMGAGPTVLLDTGAIASAMGSGTVRGLWRFQIELINLGVATAQEIQLRGEVIKLGADGGFGGGTSAAFATGAGAVDVSTRLANVFSRIRYEGRNTGAIDTTASNLVQFTVINGSATATETKLFGAIAEVI